MSATRRFVATPGGATGGELRFTFPRRDSLHYGHGVPAGLSEWAGPAAPAHSSMVPAVLRGGRRSDRLPTWG